MYEVETGFSLGRKIEIVGLAWSFLRKTVPGEVEKLLPAEGFLERAKLKLASRW